LAECAYFPGLDKYLAEYGLEYFFVDSHAFWYADERPRYGVYRPIVTPNNVLHLQETRKALNRCGAHKLGIRETQGTENSTEILDSTENTNI